MHRMANVSYRVLKDHMGGEPARRDVTVCATPGELAALDRDGFLIRESVIEGDRLVALTRALDGLTETGASGSATAGCRR